MGFPVLYAATSILGGLSGSYDPVKHAERMAAINKAFDAAMLGDSKSAVQLACMAGENSAEALAYGFANSDGVCRIGDDEALEYAKSKLAEYRLRQTVGDALGTAGVMALGGAHTAYPGAGTAALAKASVTGFLSGKTWGLPTPLVVLGAGVAGWWLFKKFARA